MGQPFNFKFDQDFEKLKAKQRKLEKSTFNMIYAIIC